MAHVLPVPGFARTDAEPLLATVGNTPLLRLEKIPAEFPGIEIFAKAEYFNPGGSVKDRAALNMILDGERSGKLNHNRTILDSTSGNTGIAYAMIGANRGYKVKLCCPANASHGAQAHSEGLRRGDGLQRSGRGLRRRHPHGAARFMKPIPTSTSIPISTTIRPTGKRTSNAPGRKSSNRPAAASRISSRPWAPAARSWERRGGCKRDLPGVNAISAQPSSGFHGLEGLKHMPTAIVPGIYDEQLADGNLWIETEDAYRWCGAWRAKKACWWASRPAATCTRPPCWRASSPKRGESGIIVTVLCDSAEKYLSEHFWDD